MVRIGPSTNIELRHLRYFVAVAEGASFTAAASPAQFHRRSPARPRGLQVHADPARNAVGFELLLERVGRLGRSCYQWCAWALACGLRSLSWTATPARRVGNCPQSCWALAFCLAELPDGAFWGVGDLDAELVELGADLVGPGPVALLAGLGAVGDELGDGVPLLGGQVADGTTALQVTGVQGGQAQAEQRVGGGHDRAQPVRRDGRIAQGVLEGGEDLRGAQVGRDRRVDGVEVPLRDGVALDAFGGGGEGLDGGQRTQRLDPRHQPAQRGLGGVHRGGGEVELAPVVAAEQEQPVGQRVVAGFGQVGQPRARRPPT